MARERSRRTGVVAAVAVIAALALLGRAHAAPPGKDASTSGYIKVPNTKDVHIFYWKFASRGNPDSDPLVLVRPRCAFWLRSALGARWVHARGAWRLLSRAGA